MSNKEYLIKVLASYIQTLDSAFNTSEQYEDRYYDKVRKIEQKYTGVLLILRQNSSDNIELNYDLADLMNKYPVID